MTVAEIAQLKSELHALNCHIQAERNDEVRHALQRGRLEAERAQTLVKLMDAVVALREVPPPPVIPQEPPPTERRRKPDGIPPTSAMIITALHDAGKDCRPSEIAEYIRRRWWPELVTASITPQVWKMGQEGRLTHRYGRYGLLNGHGGHNG